MIRKFQAGGEITHFSLVHLAKREKRTCQLRLIQPIEKVTLILRAILRLEQLEHPLHLADLGVMSSGDPISTKLEGVIEKGLEFDFGITQYVRIGRSPCPELGKKSVEHAVLVLRREVHRFNIYTNDVRNGDGIDQVLARIAVLVVIVVFPILHEQAEHFIPLLLKQPGCDRRIHSTRHADDNAFFLVQAADLESTITSSA